MTQSEKEIFLIEHLLAENPRYSGLSVPKTSTERKKMLRSLFNMRMPIPAEEEFLRVQDEYLREEIRRKGITDIRSLEPVENGLYIWRGDITTLMCGAIVNAANSQMLGCFYPCHSCIDNAIHTFSGVQLRLKMYELMKKQGHEEETGRAKITPAFNLPCKHILHTVGPIVRGKPTDSDKQALASCYRSCLELAEGNKAESIAFCCISTGEFHFPNTEAAKIAVKTVKEYKKQNNSSIEVIFNVFKETDLQIYRELLG